MVHCDLTISSDDTRALMCVNCLIKEEVASHFKNFKILTATDTTTYQEYNIFACTAESVLFVR